MANLSLFLLSHKWVSIDGINWTLMSADPMGIKVPTIHGKGARATVLRVSVLVGVRFFFCVENLHLQFLSLNLLL